MDKIKNILTLLFKCRDPLSQFSDNYIFFVHAPRYNRVHKNAQVAFFSEADRWSVSEGENQNAKGKLTNLPAADDRV